MEGGEIFFAFSADKSDWTKDLGVVCFRGKASIRILDIPSRYNYVFSNFNKVFIIPARWTRDQLGWWTIFNLHGVLILFNG